MTDAAAERADGEVLALAGVVQAVALVREIAHSGKATTERATAILQTVLRIDADTPAAVYGGLAGMAPALELLVAMLDGQRRDAELTRMAATVLHLEPRLRRRPPLLAAIREGVEKAAAVAQRPDASPDVLAMRLGEIYATTLSTLRPRVIVHGNCEYLSQTVIVARIRALLLAAVRSAVLWHQCGGSRWRLLLKRRQLADRARQLLDRARRQH